MKAVERALKKDAVEFGQHVQQGEWRLGLLVARCVERVGRGHQATGTHGKISATEFGRLAFPSNARPGTGAQKRIISHLDAWERAAADGHVPPAAELRPGQEINLDVDALEEQGVSWSNYYSHDSGGYDWATGRVRPMSEMRPPRTRGRRVRAVVKTCLDVAEAANSKREAYRSAAEALATYKEKTGLSWRDIAKEFERPESTIRALDRWRSEGYATPNPFTAGTRKKVAS